MCDYNLGQQHSSVVATIRLISLANQDKLHMPLYFHVWATDNTPDTLLRWTGKFIIL